MRGDDIFHSRIETKCPTTLLIPSGQVLPLGVCHKLFTDKNKKEITFLLY